MNSLPAYTLTDDSELEDNVFKKKLDDKGFTEEQIDKIKNNPLYFELLKATEKESDDLINTPEGLLSEETLIVVHDRFDLLRLQIKLDDIEGDVNRINSCVVAVISKDVTGKQECKITELNPNKILFISAGDEKNRRKALEKSLTKFCTQKLIPFNILYLNKDICSYLTSESDLVDKIKTALNGISRLDRTARSSEQLFSWLATQPPALKTGYKNFDKHVRIPVGAMTIIAGRPKHGKTTFLYNLMMQMAESGLYDDKKFYFFSYEENGNRIKQKMLSRILEASKFNFKTIKKIPGFEAVRNGDDLIQTYAAIRKDNPIKEIEEAGKKLDALLKRIEIVNKPLNVENLTTTINKVYEKESIAAIYIDYIQRIPVEHPQNTTRENMNFVSDKLKWCAVNTGLPLIVGAQIGRKADEKDRPSQSDIKESGNLEEDANLVLCVYNKTQATRDRGTKNEDTITKTNDTQHTIQVYTMNSRDSEPSETEFVMINRHFKEAN